MSSEFVGNPNSSIQESGISSLKFNMVAEHRSVDIHGLKDVPSLPHMMYQVMPRKSERDVGQVLPKVMDKPAAKEAEEGNVEMGSSSPEAELSGATAEMESMRHDINKLINAVNSLQSMMNDGNSELRSDLNEMRSDITKIGDEHKSYNQYLTNITNKINVLEEKTRVPIHQNTDSMEQNRVADDK